MCSCKVVVQKENEKETHTKNRMGFIEGALLERLSLGDSRVEGLGAGRLLE